MKIILITAFQAVAVKNIFRTDVIKYLTKESDVRIICLVRHPERVAYYKKELAHERVTYESYSESPHGICETLFSFLKYHTIKTKTTVLRRRAHARDNKKYILYWLSLMLTNLLHRAYARRLIRFLDYWCVRDANADAMLDRLQPDIVVLTHLFDDAEISILRSAAKKGIKTVGFVNSWDKLTARAAIRLVPKKLLVFNQIVRDEAVMFGGIPEEKITIVGIPQYDEYFRNHSYKTREEFCTQLRLDPVKKIILFAPIGKTFSDFDLEMTDALHEIINVKKLTSDSELLVRFQPNDFFDEKEIQKRSWLVYDRPGLRYGTIRGGDWDMTKKDLDHLRNTLHHSALVISYFSSIAIDAAIFDKPVININFELKKPKTALTSPILFYKTEHYSKAVAAGGIQLVQNLDELVSWVNKYLENPAHHKLKRERLVMMQCHFIDGHSSERLASAILN